MLPVRELLHADWNATSQLPDLRKIEKDLDKDIRRTFNLPAEKSQECTKADWLALFIEAAQIIPERGSDFIDPYNMRPIALELREQEGWVVACLPWQKAKAAWLQAYEEYRSAGSSARQACRDEAP